MKTILNGIVKENAIFVLSLGLCSALAVTTTVENAYLMGLCVLIVLIFSNLVISLIKKLVPDNVRIPVYIIIVGTFVVVLELLLQKFIPVLYSALGIYLPLIVVNCIVLGRALSVASKENIGKSVLDGVGVGLGYTFSITLIALIRELLGRTGNFPPNRPGFPPPRPPFRPRDLQSSDYSIFEDPIKMYPNYNEQYF